MTVYGQRADWWPLYERVSAAGDMLSQLRALQQARHEGAPAEHLLLVAYALWATRDVPPEE